MQETHYDDRVDFFEQRETEIKKIPQDKDLITLSSEWLLKANNHRYTYHFDWLGLPIIQFPQDIIAMQEIIWDVKPDWIIETGVARGGSLVFSASMLHLLNGSGKVIGIDIDIRSHNRQAIENHPLAFRIQLIQGSSTDHKIIDQIKKQISPQDKVMVILDSNHTHDHVLEELKLYSPFVTAQSYLIVMDTIIETMPSGYYENRPWNKGNNPQTAINEFLKDNNHFKVAENIHHKLLITSAKNGYLKRI